MPGHPGPIRRGVGKFTPELWDRLFDMLVEWEQKRRQMGYPEWSNYTRDIPHHQGRRFRPRLFMMAIVYGELAQEISANRWRYPWQEAKLSGDTWSVDEDGLAYDSGDTDTWALNSVEASNDGLGVEAPGVTIEGPDVDYPAGFSLQPITGQPVVPLFFFKETDGTMRYVFSLANAHDGTCE
jgi:hypothetical protein